MTRADATQPYIIVGAGIFDLAGKAIGPVYNKTDVVPVLSTTRTPSGQFDVTFKEYQQPKPTDKFTYILKATPMGKVDYPVSIVVTSFRPKSIRISALMGQGGVDIIPSFMIEISQFGTP